jgi:hypothetical protein
MAVRSPWIWRAGPEVCWKPTSSSLAMMLARVVLRAEEQHVV